MGSNNMRRISNVADKGTIKVIGWPRFTNKIIFEGLLFACGVGGVVYLILKALGA
jgi:hypothetical protein